MSPLLITLVTFLAFGVVAEETSKPAANPKAKPLLKAYQKEYAFLVSQRATLKKELEDLRARKKAKLSGVKADILDLEKQWMKISSRSKSVQYELTTLERNIESSDFNKERVLNTIKQAKFRLSDSLSAEDHKVLDAKDEIKAVELVFHRAPLALASLATPQWTEESFFDDKGKKREGQVVRLGNIAGFVFSKDQSGSATPVGSNGLKMAAPVTFDMASFSSQSILPFYLVDSLTSDFSEPRAKTMMDEIRAGGAIGYVIMALGFVALFFAILRFILLRAAGNSQTGLTRSVIEKLKSGEPKEAASLCASNSGALSRVLGDIVKNIDRSRESLEEVVSESILSEERKLRRFATLVLIAAAVAPLLGLLGTVTGMISTFDVITEFGTGDPKMLSSGVSEALLTTKFGLIVAIPAVLAGNLLSNWASRIKSEIEQSALSVLNAIKGNA